ncbi:hypothetical protein V6N13_016260 [Hibiscus sabdariffa]
MTSINFSFPPPPKDLHGLSQINKFLISTSSNNYLPWAIATSINSSYVRVVPTRVVQGFIGRRSRLIRCLTKVPENTVYGGLKPQTPNQRMTLNHLKQKYKKGEPITDPSAVYLDTAGIDVCLVGDSTSMDVHGLDTTLRRLLLVAPSGHYSLVTCHLGPMRPAPLRRYICDFSSKNHCVTIILKTVTMSRYAGVQQAVDTAVKILKEGVDAVKLEEGSPSRITTAKDIVEAEIAVIGHMGLTPQLISVVETAIALQEAGCFTIILECAPAPVGCGCCTTSALQIKFPQLASKLVLFAVDRFSSTMIYSEL